MRSCTARVEPGTCSGRSLHHRPIAESRHRRWREPRRSQERLVKTRICSMRGYCASRSSREPLLASNLRCHRIRLRRTAPGFASGGRPACAHSHSHLGQHETANVDRPGSVCILHSEFSITVLMSHRLPANQLPVMSNRTVENAMSHALATDAARARMPSVVIR